MTTVPDGDAVTASPSSAGATPPEVFSTRTGPTGSKTRPIWQVVLVNIALALGALLMASLVIFLTMHYLPGDPAAIKGGVDASPAQIEAIRRELGLDRPVLVQYGDWFADMLRLNFGRSTLSHRDIGAELLDKLAVTAPLSLASLLLAILVATPLGVLAAVGRRTWWGQTLTGLGQVGVAVPAFILGIILVDLFAVRAGLVPATGFPIDGWARPDEAVRSLLLPTITLAVPQAAILMRFVRSSTVDVLHLDHLRTARAQGLGWWRALGQSWRMIALPLTAVIALDFASLITGSVLVEQVFALPGVGTFLLSSVSARDTTVVQSVLMLMSGLIIVVMTGANLIQRLLDPRLR